MKRTAPARWSAAAYPSVRRTREERGMGLELVAIDVAPASPKPVFRVISATGPARILIRGVGRADLYEPAWEIMSAAWADRPTYAASAQIILERQQVL